MRALILLLFCVAVHAAPTPSEPLPLEAGLNRGIPAEAKRGVMQIPSLGVVAIGGVTLQMAAGLQIRDTHNRIVLSATLGQPHLVKYVTDAQGQLFRVWILTRAEAAQP